MTRRLASRLARGLLVAAIGASGLTAGAVTHAASAATVYTISTQADFNAISARTYQPGDEILFARGATFAGNLVLQGSGTAAAPIVIGATGTGAAPAIVASGAVAAFQFTGVSNYTIQDLDISAPSGAGISIQLASAPTSGVSGFRILHDTFHDIQNTVDHTRQLSPEYDAVHNKAAVMIGTWHDAYANMTNYAISDVLVDDSEFYRVHNGVYTAGNESQANGNYADKPRNSNITVRNSSFHDIIGEGTVYLATVNSLITDDSYVDVSHDPGTHVAPVWMVGSSYIVVQRSTIIDAVPSDGMAIDFDWRTDNSTYQYNFSARNGEWAYPCSVYNNFNNTLRYNISYDDFAKSDNCYDSTGGEQNLSVYNNTLVNFQGWNLHAVGATFKNNIIDYADSTKNITVTGSATFSNNLYVNHTSTETGAVNTTDPQFVHPGADPQGFKLKSPSPAIGAGVAVAGNGGLDYYGDTVPSGAPDIGASQYYAADTPASTEWNLAEGANVSVTASSEINNSLWAPSALTDGMTKSLDSYNTNRLGFSTSSSSTANHSEWVTLNLGSQKTFNKIVLWPRSDNGHEGYDFPSSFQIQVWNGASWITRVTETNYFLGTLGGQEFTWGHSDYTNQIRILATSLTNQAGGYYLQLAGMQVFNDNNLAAGVAGTTVQVSSSVNGNGWYQNNLVDGQTSSFGGSMGWSSALGLTTQHQEWAQINLPSIQTFSKIVLYPRNDGSNAGAGFPTSFEIQVWNGANWITRLTETNYPTPTTPQTFTWGSSDNTNEIRIVGTQLPQVGSDYVMQLAQVQVYS